MAQVQLLVTVSASAFADRIRDAGDPLTLVDLPSLGAGELGVRGLALPTSLLRGLGRADFDLIRDAGDKANCPSLLLHEDQPLGLADPDPAVRAGAVDRIQQLSKAAEWLGCANLGLSIAGEDGEESFEVAASTVRETMHAPSRFEVGVLLESRPGITGDPGRLTDLIKKIGGFRIGSLPDFRFAHDTGDFEGVLRRLAPYAGTIFATVGKSARGEAPAPASRDATPYDLRAGVQAVLAVGYQHAICLDHAGGGGAIQAIINAREIIEDAIVPDQDEPDAVESAEEG